MKFHTIIPAVDRPSREGLTMVVTKLETQEPGAQRLHLAIPGSEGAAILEIGKTEKEFVFAFGKARLDSVGDVAGKAFVDAVAAWLGLVADGDAAEDIAEPKLDWVCLSVGGWWMGFKLFLSSTDERHAEVFFRLSVDYTQAQFHEKWSAYRPVLVELLERALADTSPRRFVPRSTPARSGDSDTSFGIRAALDLEIPNGWVLTERIVSKPEARGNA